MAPQVHDANDAGAEATGALVDAPLTVWGDESTSALSDLFWGLWARRGSVLAVGAIVAGLVLLLSAQQPLSYRSSAEVMIKPVMLDPAERTSVDFKTLEPERRVAESAEVAAMAAKRLGTDPRSTSLSVSAPPQSDTLVFLASAQTSKVAALAAQAYAEGYLEYRRQHVKRAVQAVVQPVNNRIAELDGQIETTQRSLAASTTEAERAAFQMQLTSLLGQRSVLDQKRNGLRLPENLEVGQILRPAVPPARQASPNRARAVTLAVFLALCVGFGQAIVRSRLDPRLEGWRDLALTAGAPVLGQLPALSSNASRGRGRLVALSAPLSSHAEAQRALRAMFLFAAVRQSVRSVVVAGSANDDDSEATAANLAVVLAHAGKSVVLVSADVLSSPFGGLFPPEHLFGLSHVLSGERAVLASLSYTSVSGLRVLHVGDAARILPEHVGSEAMATALSELNAAADFVIVGAPPVLQAADTLALASITDGVLLVAAARQTAVGALAEARVRLDQVGAHVLGAILTNVDARMVRYDQRRQARPRATAAPVPASTGWSA